MRLPSGHYTAVLLDPDLRWLEAVELVLEQAGVDVVVRTTSAEQALSEIRHRNPDLLVTEAQVNGEANDGIETVRRAHAMAPELKSIVLSSEQDQRRIAAAFDAGAIAYFVKPARPKDLPAAVRRAFGGPIYLSSAGLAAAHERKPRTSGGDTSSGDTRLTRREREILRLVMQGLTNTEVAQALWVTEPTVKFHLSNIYRKLGVSNRAEAARWAREHGLQPPAAARAR